MFIIENLYNESNKTGDWIDFKQLCNFKIKFLENKVIVQMLKEFFIKQNQA